MIENIKKAIELLEKLADEKKWEKNARGYWVYSETCPFVIAKEVLEELEQLQAENKKFRSILTQAYEYLEKGGKIVCGSDWHGDVGIALEGR